MTTLADIVADVKAVPPGAVIVLRGVCDDITGALFAALRDAGHSDVFVVHLLDEDATLDVLDTEQMAAAGWVRKPPE